MSGANWTQAEYDERIARLKLPPAPAEAPTVAQLCISCAGACDKSKLRSVQAVCSQCGNHGIVWEIPGPTSPPAKAKGRMPWSQPMNATECTYDAHLRNCADPNRLIADPVRWWDFQPITILLGPDCRFTPDFLVLYSDDRLELHDTKGAKKIKVGKRAGEKTFWAEEDARIKARVTAAQFPIPIYFVWSLGDGSWGKKGFGE